MASRSGWKTVLSVGLRKSAGPKKIINHNLFFEADPLKSSIKKIFRHWRIFYLIVTLVFMGWVIHAGGNEFDRINSQYRSLVARLDDGLIRKAAVDELLAECRREVKERPELKEGTCRSWPDLVVDAKALAIKERRIQAKERGFVKAMLFYFWFVVIFLLGPPLFVYLFLIGAIKIYKSIKFVQE